MTYCPKFGSNFKRFIIEILDIGYVKYCAMDYFRSTNEDGRCPGLITSDAFTPGMYKIRFETGQYWESLGQSSFYPYVEVRRNYMMRESLYLCNLNVIHNREMSLNSLFLLHLGCLHYKQCWSELSCATAGQQILIQHLQRELVNSQWNRHTGFSKQCLHLSGHS